MKLKRPNCSPRILALAPLGLVLGLSVAEAAAADYPTTILGDNPSAYYRLEETSGTVAADASVNGVPATYTYNSAMTDPQLGLPGIDINSILFNGGGYSSDVGFVDIPASPLITPVGDFGTNGAPFLGGTVGPTDEPAGDLFGSAGDGAISQWLEHLRERGRLRGDELFLSEHA
ncbi:MAG TPA: hypothetical protein VG167_14685 [Verrucomicrobiae bacterium]|nr:hypothetical protein [Verrucomicrobiae bacterium]